VLVAAFDRVARSVKHFLQVMDEFDSLGIVFISRRENIDTSGPMGRLFLTLIGSIAELESDLISLDGVIYVRYGSSDIKAQPEIVKRLLAAHGFLRSTI